MLSRIFQAVGLLLVACLLGCERASVPMSTENMPAAAVSDMVLIPAGKFMMGSDRVDDGGLQQRYGFEQPLFLNEHPRHSVHTAAYYIDRLEVTNGQYQAFVAATGREVPFDWTQNAYNLSDAKLQSAHVDNLRWIATDYFKLDQDTRVMSREALLDAMLVMQRERDVLPVAGVSWFDANSFCRWQDKRLPTEIEWEKAARGEAGQVYPWGNDWRLDLVNSGELAEGDVVLLPVGTMVGDRSPYGVMDMAGNVSEWTADWYAAYLVDQRSGKSGAAGVEADEYYGKRHRVLRGGGAGMGHYALSVFFRAAHRAHASPEMTSNDVGFRCARDRGRAAG